MNASEKKDYIKKFNDHFTFISLNSDETTFILDETDGTKDDTKCHVLCQTSSILIGSKDKTKVLMNILEDFIKKLEKVMPFFENRRSVYFLRRHMI